MENQDYVVLLWKFVGWSVWYFFNFGNFLCSLYFWNLILLEFMVC